MAPDHPHTPYTYVWFERCFEQARSDARRLHDTWPESRLNRPPAPGRWSAAECIDHLNSFGTIYFDTIERAVGQARPDAAASPGPFRPRLFWRGVVRIFEPPYRMKMKTIPSFSPDDQPTLKVPDVFGQFDKLQQRFIHQLERCRQKGIDLGREKVSNPALSFLKMQLAECYAVTDAHQRRHLWQARRTLRLDDADPNLG